MSSIFISSYEKIQDPKIRVSLLKLLKFWPQYFPPDIIWKLEQKMRARYRVHKDLLPKVGSNYKNKIHVNPNFFSIPKSSQSLQSSTSFDISRNNGQNNTKIPPHTLPDRSYSTNSLPQQTGPSIPMNQSTFPMQLNPFVYPQQPPPHISLPQPIQQGIPQQPAPYSGMIPSTFHNQFSNLPPYGMQPGMIPSYGMQPGFNFPYAPNMFPQSQSQPVPSIQPLHQDVTSILDSIEKSTKLSSENEASISKLYDFKLKCNVCGLRFHFQNVLDQHLEDHFNLSNESKKAIARDWFQDEDDWDKEIRINQLKNPAAKSFDKLSENAIRKRKIDEISQEENTEFDYVQADPDQESCPICHEPFTKFFNQDEQDWMYKDAKIDTDPNRITYNKIVHSSCLSFALSSPDQQNKRRKFNDEDLFS